jgi:hypothetical protein
MREGCPEPLSTQICCLNADEGLVGWAKAVSGVPLNGPPAHLNTCLLMSPENPRELRSWGTGLSSGPENAFLVRVVSTNCGFEIMTMKRFGNSKIFSHRTSKIPTEPYKFLQITSIGAIVMILKGL